MGVFFGFVLFANRWFLTRAGRKILPCRQNPTCSGVWGVVWMRERGRNIAECYERGAYTRNMTGCLCTRASYKVY